MTHSKYDTSDKEYEYSTIKRGKVKVTSERQHILLHTRNLPHTHVYRKSNGALQKIRSR